MNTPATKPLKRSHRSIELNVKHIRLTLFQGVDSELASKIIQKCREIGIMRMEKRGVYFFTDLG